MFIRKSSFVKSQQIKCQHSRLPLKRSDQTELNSEIRLICLEFELSCFNEDQNAQLVATCPCHFHTSAAEGHCSLVQTTCCAAGSPGGHFDWNVSRTLSPVCTHAEVRQRSSAIPYSSSSLTLSGTARNPQHHS